MHRPTRVCVRERQEKRERELHTGNERRTQEWKSGVSWLSERRCACLMSQADVNLFPSVCTAEQICILQQEWVTRVWNRSEKKRSLRRWQHTGVNCDFFHVKKLPEQREISPSTSHRQRGEDKPDLLHWDCASYSAAVVGLTGKLSLFTTELYSQELRQGWFNIWNLLFSYIYIVFFSEIEFTTHINMVSTTKFIKKWRPEHVYCRMRQIVEEQTSLEFRGQRPPKLVWVFDAQKLLTWWSSGS